MNHQLRPSPEYKDSGLPWLGEVPAHWDVRRNGRLFAQRNETGFGDLPILEVSLKTGVRVRDMDNMKRKQVMSDRDKYKRAAEGDIAYNMMRMWQGAVGAAPVDGLISPAYVVARPFPGTETRYFSYLFRTAAYMAEVDGYSRGIVKDRNRLYWEDFKRIPSCYPPPEEQTAIANYLDANGVLVRKFIRNRRRLIEVLSEQKQAIINQAVTRGLDPSVPLKPSGIDWLGDVPEHWSITKLKHSVAFKGGGTPSKSVDRYWKGTIPWVSPKDMKRDSIDDAEDHITEEALHASSAVLIEPGAVLIVVRSGILRRKIPTAVNTVPVALNQDMRAMTPKEGLSSSFLKLLIDGQQNALLFEWTKQGATVESIEHEYMANSWIPIPPLSEQLAIVQRITDDTNTLDHAILVANREIDLIREYRTRLIADVVTGKLDVRHLAPPPDSLDTDALTAHDADEDLVDELPEDESAEMLEEAIDAKN